MPSHSLDVLTSLAPAVPAALVASAESRDRAVPPAAPRTAASVVLCRDGAAGLETFLLHRHARMAFAASMAVFPGGGLDRVDQRAADPLRACAVRETYEETGVELAAADLVPWAHWITPEEQPIRYDTFFYLAVLPAEQAAGDLSTETERSSWTSPREALTAYESGELAMMPPTVSILIELGRARSTAEAVAAGDRRIIEPVLPVVVRTEVGWAYRYPRPSHRGSVG